MYPFVRDDEQRQRTPGNNPGVRLTLPSGHHQFYPGGTLELATILMNAAVPNSLVTDPRTVVEFGEMRGTEFVCQQLVKPGIT